MRPVILVTVAATVVACAERQASIDATPTWSLTPVPRLSIGSDDGDERYTFTRIVGARFLATGGVLVADFQPSLTIYDSTGAFVRRVGRRGAGPGEFDRLFASPLVYRGDSIAVWDLGPRRVSVFDGAGTFARSATILIPRRYWEPGTIPAQSCCTVAAALTDGSFVLEYPATIPNGPGPQRYSTTLLARVAPDGSMADTIGAFEAKRYRYEAAAPSAVRDIHLTGRFAYTVVGDTIFGGNGAGAWLLRIVPGLPPDTIRLPVNPVPVTAAVREAYANAWRAEFARRPQFFEGPVEELFDGEYAEKVPTYTDVVPDGAGGLWLRQWQLPFSPDSSSYHVYSTRGHSIARITIPPSARIGDIRGGRVALIETDSLGVEYIRVYGVVR